MEEKAEPAIEVDDKSEASRYEIRLDGSLAGFADYRLEDQQIVFSHTEIAPEFGGRGLGKRLVEFAVTDARSRGLDIVPHCPFVKSWIEEHPERQ